MSTGNDNRLTFREGLLERDLDAEVDDIGAAVDAPPKRNRALVFVGAVMAGLTLLGIVALAATVFYWLPAEQGRRMAAATSTVSALTRVAAAWTATPVPTSTPLPPPATSTPEPTQTPAPTATATRVVRTERVGGQLAIRTSTPEFPETTPEAGLGVGGMAAAAAGLTTLLFVARGLRGKG